MKLKALLTLLKSKHFILISVSRNDIAAEQFTTKNNSMSANIIFSTILLRLYEEKKQEIETAAADAGQVRNLEAVRDAVKALEATEYGGN